MDRLREPVKGHKERNAAAMAGPDNDAGHAVPVIEMFIADMHKLRTGRIVGHKQ